MGLGKKLVKAWNSVRTYVIIVCMIAVISIPVISALTHTMRNLTYEVARVRGAVVRLKQKE